MSNPYAIDSIAYSPYFQAALNSPNFYGMQAPASVPQATDTTGAVTNNAETTVVKKTKEEKKDNTTAKIVIGTALTLGAAYLCRKAYKAGDGNILDGISKWAKSLKNKFSGVKDKIANPEVFSITEESGRTICTLPGKTNKLKGQAAIQELGISDVVPNISTTNNGITKLAEGIKLGKGTITLSDGTQLIVADGKILKSSTNLEQASEAIRKEAHELLAKFNKGEAAPGIKFRSFTHTEGNTSRIFKMDANGQYQLSRVNTNKFNLNSDAVNQFRGNNKKIDDVIKDYMVNGNKDGLKVISAEVPSSIGTFVIKNGEIAEIKIGTDVYKKGSVKFDSLLYQNKSMFENALKDKNAYQNAVYKIA